MDIREFKNTYSKYSPCAIWDWCAKPTPEEIDKRLYEFSQMGIGTVFVRPSKGLVVQYLSGDFFELIRSAARRSEKYSVELWICDENSSASGHGGGEITSVVDYCMRDIVKADKENLLKTDISVDGDFALRDMSKVRASHRAPLADITDAFVTECFTDHVYNAYLRECKRFIGHEIHGFLTHINFPQEALLFSPATLKRLDDCSAEQCAHKLTTGDNAFKARYHSAFSDCVAQNFTGFVKEKCSANDLQLCVGVNGAAFLSRQSQYIKADMVSVEMDTENPDLAAFKLAESICAQFEKPLMVRLLLDSYAPCSERYNAAAFFAAMGAARICYDSVAFSLSDRRKYEKHTVVLSKFTEKDISGRVSRLSNISAKTASSAKVLLVCTPENADSLSLLARKLLLQGIPFHIAEDDIFKKHSEFKDGIVQIGACNYNTVIAQSDIKIPDEFSGAKITFDPAVPCDLSELIDENFLKISADKEIYINRRYDEKAQYVFVTALKEDCVISADTNGKELCVADSSNGEIYSLPENEDGCSFTLKAGKTALLIYSSDLCADEAPPYAGDIEIIPSQKECDVEFALSAAEENILPLKRVNACFGRKSYRESNIDDLHREFYCLNDNETVKVKYPFTVKLKDIGTVKAYIENADNLDTIELNGKKLSAFSPSEKDPRFLGTDITPYLSDGKNTFALEYKKFSNYTPDFSSLTPPHFYSFNPTSFEPVYLCGDFDCEDGLLTQLGEYESDVSRSGMPYYYGALTYSARLPESDLSSTMLSVSGNFDICRIRIGKREQIFFTQSPLMEIFNLDCGAVAEITIFNTPYNLLRPAESAARPFGLKTVELCKFSN